MEGTQKFDARSQTSCSIEHVLSKSAVNGDGRSRPLAMSSTSHHSDNPSADTKIILGWMRELPKEFLDTIRELMSMALDRFGQLNSAAVNHPEDVSDLEEQEKRFRLFMDGDSDLDERLSEAPDVRSLFVTILKALVRELGKGSTSFSAEEIRLLIFESAISLFAPEQRQTLSEETDKVVGQAPDHPLLHGKRLACGSPETAPEDLKAIKIQIKSSIANLYGLLSTSRHLGKISDAPEARQNEEIESAKRRPFFPDKIKDRARNLYQRVRISIMPPGGSQSPSHDDEDSCVPHSNRAYPGSKQSSCSASSPSDPSLFWDNGTYGRVHPLTNATASTSLSKVEQSSNSIRASTGSQKFSPSPSKAEKTFEPKVPSKQLRQVSAERLVWIKHQNSQCLMKKLMLTDTGTHENLIRRSVVDELGLTIVPSDPISLTGLDDYKVKSHGYVVPDWYFDDKPKPKKHPGIAFQVIEKIPNSVDILLGGIFGSGLGIDLYESSVCVAHQALEDTVAQERRKQQRIIQDRDTTENGNKLRQAFEARHAKLIEEREAAAEASDHTKP